jgi:UDP-glucose:(heptosyl)LPS alpha-1,3-glucosyltransferase
MSNSSLTIGLVRRGYSASGGAEAYLKRLGRGLASRGHDAWLFTTGDWPREEWPFGQVVRLSGRSTVGFADEVEKRQRQERCDVLMSLERIWRCDVYRAGDGVHLAWLNRRRKFELPLRRFVRGLQRKHREILLLEESLLVKRGAGRVIANSQMVRNEIVNLYHYPAEAIEIVRNGVPLDRFRFDPQLREKSRAELKLKPDETALLFAGSGWERKGLRFAIEAMEGCRDRKMRLLVAGRGNKRLYKAKHSRFLADEPIQFLGEVADPVSVYAAADIFILPSVYDPFSNACLEALACGLPVITTRDNGFKEIIEDRIHGSIVDSAEDVVELRHALELWSDPVRRTAARPTILKRASEFDVSKNVDKTLQILFQVAADHAS